MIALGVDPGIINLGMVLVEIAEHMEVTQVLDGVRVDLTQLEHTQVPRQVCTLYHTSMHCDWIDHLLQEYQDWFDRADVVLVEQQPPGGHTSIEQLIVKACRSKVQLVSPRSVHSLFNMIDQDYDTRKEIIVERTQHLLQHFTENETRKHDIADALALVLHFVHGERKKYLQGVRIRWLERITAHRKPVKHGDLSQRLQQYRRKPCLPYMQPQ